MNRRQFLTTTVASASLAGIPLASRAAAEVVAATAPGREFFELRQYHLRRGPMQRVFDDYVRNAAIPAMNRLGIEPIGVFNVATGFDSPSTYVLIPYRTIEQFATVNERLAADEEYRKAGATFINATADNPVYSRMESSLFKAFAGMPKLEVPKLASGAKPKLYELRIYESHSKQANKKKIEMFNQGEIAIFRRTGLTPVFFGEARIGSRMPNLTYLLAFEDMAAHDKNWSTFGGDPEWRALSSKPEYADPAILTNISNVFLRPGPGSQV
jgi:hypothetical protein